MAGTASLETDDRLRIVRRAWPGPRMPEIWSQSAAAGLFHALGDCAEPEAAATHPINAIAAQRISFMVFFISAAAASADYIG